MRSSTAFLLTLLLLSASRAQTPFVPVPPATAASPWGGYAVPGPVPYQPTLPPGAVVPAQAMVSPTWQTYPSVDGGPNQAVMLDNLSPGVAPAVMPAEPPISTDPGYPVTSEPDLKKSLIPPGSRDGFFQKVEFDATWIPSPDSTSLGWLDLHTDVVTALPFFTRENPIIITPGYTSHSLDGPTSPDLPAHLNDITMDFHIFRVYLNHWIADFAVTPGLFADDHSFGSNEALRVNGRALGLYAPTIDLKYALGVTYLDGGWSKIVPIAGVIYTPTDDVEYQLVFPTPRISWRLNDFTPIPGADERWVYVSLEYGNQAWAFKDLNGTDDVLAYRDYRVLLGFERRIVGGVSHRVEVGYVFNRDIKVASISGNDISQGSSILLRAGIRY
ncbi:MAG TPA: hypothetical protein VH107_10225 [Lacipirellulaceae bacterium]|nr:hypothetical protein [Lacipirellulaceae bacterium]